LADVINTDPMLILKVGLHRLYSYNLLLICIAYITVIRMIVLYVV